MLIILSQKIDTTSEYSDTAFETYHYPARYKNQIHEGDTFIYYQGNRFVKEQRYYFGTGTVGKISTTDGENYYASLVNGQRFKSNVPIYLPNEKYVEQLGYETVRKSPTPPWQSSVRTLSQQAFDYIISASGIEIKSKESASVDELKEQLKTHIRAFYLDDDINAILEIKNISSEIINTLSLSESTQIQELLAYQPSADRIEKVQGFIEYCKTTHITYSYKPVLLLAFFKSANKDGIMKLTDGIRLVRQYYQSRRTQNKAVEKKKSIYLKINISDDEIRKNLISNPIKALSESGYFFFNNEKQELSFMPELWPSIGHNEITIIEEICDQRLEKYYNG